MTGVSRRSVIFGAQAVALLGMPRLARAQAYPSGNIRMLCAFPAGAGLDVMVRYFAEKLRPLAERTIVVENRPGAAGNIATEAFVRSKPDGLTIYVHAGNLLAATRYLIKNNPVDARKQIQIAATISRQAFMLVVDAKAPWKTIPELTAHLKAKGDKATYATGGIGVAVGDVMAEIYKSTMGLQAVAVNYRNAQDALNDMASGRIDFACLDPVFALAQQREGRLRILAVASKDRRAPVPDVPSMSEYGIAMDLLGWFAVMVPAGTPRPIVDQLNTWTRQILANEETGKFVATFGGETWVTTPEEGQARLNKDIDDWAEYVRVAKLTPQ